MMKRRSLGRRIKKFRKEKKMTQTDLAKAAGYSDKSGIARVESGENFPGAERLEKIAYALGVSPEFLIGEDRPEVSNLVDRVTDENFGSTLTDSQVSKLNNLLDHPTLLDTDVEDVFRMMIKDKLITYSNGELAVIRYGNPTAPYNEEEYSVYRLDDKGELEREPFITLKAYVNHFKPELMLKWIYLRDSGMDAEDACKEVISQLIEAANALKLESICTSSDSIEKNGTPISREENREFLQSFNSDIIIIVN